MTELSRNIVSTYDKASRVTSGYLIERYSQKKKRESYKGGSASAAAKNKLPDEIKKLAIVSFIMHKIHRPLDIRFINNILSLSIQMALFAMTHPT